MVKTERTVSVSLEDGKKMQRIPPVRNYQIWMFVYEKFFFKSFLTLKFRTNLEKMFHIKVDWSHKIFSFWCRHVTWRKKIMICQVHIQLQIKTLIDFTNLSQSITRVQESQLVPLQTLDVLHHQGEVGHGLQTQLSLKAVQHVLGEK